MTTPTCWIIAGPNGSGKTTFARDFLPNVAGTSRFINADLIAAGLSPFAPEEERFPRSLRNLFNDFSVMADHSVCLMNNQSPPKLVFENQGEKRIIHDNELYERLQEESQK